MAPLEPFATDRRVAVAVSGGADSTALALLLSWWGQPEAFIVDHGLRREAAAEAQSAGEQLARFGVSSRILRIQLPDGPALSQRARVARYAALSSACTDAGLADLLIGHHGQDQAETFLLREKMGSGPTGLAGMASVTYRAGVRLLRPLLNTTPDRLRATLRQAGVQWSEDPGNFDPSRPRAALREQFVQRGAEYVLAHKASAGRAGTCRQGAERVAASEMGRSVAFHPEGFARISGPLSFEAASALVWTLSGRAHPPSPDAVRRRMCPISPGTLHGLAVAPAGRLGAGWLVAREAAGANVPAVDGATWDGRFRLHGAPPPGTVIGALGSLAAVRAFTDLPAIVLRTLPALHRNRQVIAVPHLRFPNAESCRNLSFSFEPGRPAGPAAFMPA